MYTITPANRMMKPVMERKVLKKIHNLRLRMVPACNEIPFSECTQGQNGVYVNKNYDLPNLWTSFSAFLSQLRRRC